MHRNTLFILSLVIVLSFSAKNSFAQYPGMAAFRQQQNMQFVNRQMNMQMQMAGMRGIMGSEQEYDFLVTMRDSTKKEIKSAIYTDTATKKHFIVLVDKKYKKTDTNRYKKIYPSQTLNLTCLISNNDVDGSPVTYIPCKATDTCWMFKAISGPINAYSYVIENDVWHIDPSTIVGIQFNDGPIVKFNEDNLKQMVGQDINALENIEKKNYLRAIKKYNRDIEKAAKK